MGFRNVVDMNNACMINLVPKLMSRDNHIWCQVVKGKYDRGNNNLENVVSKPQDSSLWKHIVKSWPIMKYSTFGGTGNDLNLTYGMTDGFVQASFNKIQVQI